MSSGLPQINSTCPLNFTWHDRVSKYYYKHLVANYYLHLLSLMKTQAWKKDLFNRHHHHKRKQLIDHPSATSKHLHLLILSATSSTCETAPFNLKCRLLAAAATGIQLSTIMSPSICDGCDTVVLVATSTRRPRLRGSTQ